jgi:pimeloyl-ACP methyl ester carboxylesterase
LRIVLAVLLLLLAGCSADPPAPAEVRLEVRESPQGIAWAELGAGPPLLMLNGTASPMAEWDPAFLQAMSAGHRVIVIDYPGLGASTAELAPTFAGMADQVADLLTGIGVDGTAVLGWSMGGFIAQELLRRHPERFSAAVLVGTNPGGPDTTLGPRWVQRADSDPDAGLATYLRTNYPRNACAQAAGEAFLERLEDAVDSGRYPVSDVPASTYDQMVAAEDPWLESRANLAGLRDVEVPVLVIVGDQDVITPADNSRLIASAIPGAQLTLVTGAGHSALFQAPEATASAINRFLDGGAASANVASGCGERAFQ